jgi:hypothetical protein
MIGHEKPDPRSCDSGIRSISSRYDWRSSEVLLILTGDSVKLCPVSNLEHATMGGVNTPRTSAETLDQLPKPSYSELGVGLYNFK